jgi:hypothetical protein
VLTGSDPGCKHCHHPPTPPYLQKIFKIDREILKPLCIRCSHFKVDDVSALEPSSKPPVRIVEDNVTASLHQQRRRDVDLLVPAGLWILMCSAWSPPLSPQILVGHWSSNRFEFSFKFKRYDWMKMIVVCFITISWQICHKTCINLYQLNKNSFFVMLHLKIKM